MKKSLGRRLRDLFSGPAGAGGPSGNKGIEQFLEDLEDTLIESDLGATAAMSLMEEIEPAARKGRIGSREDLVGLIQDRIARDISAIEISPKPDGLSIFLVLGVNGVGKTTTIAKLAHRFAKSVGTERVVLAAGDTFRAAAIEQLATHGERLGVRVVRQADGSDPAAVIYDAITSAQSRGDSVVLADTAGRMHNKDNLVRQLEKIDKIVVGKAAGADYKRLLVIDATTGQNGLRQAEIFHEAVGVDAVILAKYDSSARGGVAVAISKSLGIPIAFLGVGEKMDDVVPFDKEQYLQDLMAASDSEEDED